MLILLLPTLKFPFKHLLGEQLFCLKNFAVTTGLVYTKARIVTYYLITTANLFYFYHLTLHNLDK
jgi:hypothetical protein